MESFDCFRRCSACESPDRYCATYIGPRFGISGQPTIFFVGLDGGKDDGHVRTSVEEWRKAVLANYRVEHDCWNPHYRACIQITADLLGGMPCEKLCQKRCAGYPDDLCALSHFAQGNAVKCVKAGSPTMEFRQHHLIPHCLPLIIEELAGIQPDVIILQSRKCLEDKFYELLSPSFGTFAKESYTEYSGVLTWKTQKQSIVVSTHHPSYALRGFGSFEAYMEQHVKPRLQTVHTWLQDRLDLSSLREDNRQLDMEKAGK
jgi:uracil-DNA glycosylase